MKIQEHIGFEDKSHKYTNLNTNETYTSVTTFIHKAFPHFEPSLQNASKTMQDKSMTYDEVIELWRKINNRAIFRGNSIHNCNEDVLNGQDPYNRGKYWHNFYVSWKEILIYAHFAKEMRDQCLGMDLKVEELIWHDQLKIAGQADFRFIDKGICIRDWKTNDKDLVYTGYSRGYGKNNHIEDGELSIYRLQLSLYGYFLSRKLGMPVQDLVIYHLRGYKVVPIKLRYSQSYTEDFIDGVNNYNPNKTIWEYLV
jgi:hypothetical protein